MDRINLLSSNPKEPKTFTISKSNVEWMTENVPEGMQSKLVDYLLTRYIRRQEARQLREQEKA